MNNEVIVSCPVTGGADAAHLHPDLPITPKQIADAAIQAAKAGAAIAHCHVRDPETGNGVRDVALYREVVERIRESDTDVIINLTAGMGGGTGTGAAPIVAEVARELGILTVAVVTKPFMFEGGKRMSVAESGLKELEESVDSLITIPNEKL